MIRSSRSNRVVFSSHESDFPPNASVWMFLPPQNIFGTLFALFLIGLVRCQKNLNWSKKMSMLLDDVYGYEDVFPLEWQSKLMSLVWEMDESDEEMEEFKEMA